jgi:uncharacterized protein (TIGR03437 family)
MMRPIHVCLSFVMTVGIALAQRPPQYSLAAIAGGGTNTGTVVTPTDALISPETAIAYDATGSLFILEPGSPAPRVRRLGNDGQLRTLSTGGFLPLPASRLCALGPGCRFNWSLAIRSDGAPIVASLSLEGFPTTSFNVLQLNSAGALVVLAGTGKRGFADGPSGTAQFAEISALATDTAGNIYVADDGNFRIRKISATGIVSTIAGTGVSGSQGDNGAAMSAQISTVSGLAVSGGNIYFTQPKLHTVRRIRADGVIETFAGNGKQSAPVDGMDARSTPLSSPISIAAFPDGRVLFVDPFAGSGSAALILIDIAGKLWSVYDENGQQDPDSPVIACVSPSTQEALNPSALAVSPNGPIALAHTSRKPSSVIYLLSPASFFVSAAGTVSAASYSRVMSPGQIFVLFGVGLGPKILTNGAFDKNGVLPTDIAGTQVLFDGLAAPLLWVRDDTLAGIVPYGVAKEMACTVMQVKQGNNVSAKIAKLVFTESPGIFSLDSSGAGQAAALNEDGSVNRPANPVKPGHFLILYATGAGRTSPASSDGKVTVPPDLPKPMGDVSVTIAGQNAPVQYAGAAPFLVAGVIQVNVMVPANIPSGPSVPIELSINGNSSGGYSSNPITIAIEGVNSPQLRALTFSSSTITGGNPLQGTVVLTVPALAGGVTVSLRSTSSTITVPATVTVPAGSISATFSISTPVIRGTESAAIVASYNGITLATSLTITAPAAP